MEENNDMIGHANQVTGLITRPSDCKKDVGGTGYFQEAYNSGKYQYLDDGTNTDMETGFRKRHINMP